MYENAPLKILQSIFKSICTRDTGRHPESTEKKFYENSIEFQGPIPLTKLRVEL